MRRRPYLGNFRRDLKTFAAGAACGFTAGAVLVAGLLWHYGPALGARVPSLTRSIPVIDDVDAAVLESAGERPVATVGPENRAAGTATIGPAPSSPAELMERDLIVPVEGVGPESLTRQFDEVRGGSRRHEAIDILAPRNTPVKAVESGRIARLFQSRAGGLTIYQFDPTERFCYYYAHLEKYAPGLREGDVVRKGQVIGYVGTSGNAPADTPHLHFAIFRLTETRRWWEGVPIDPYDVLR
jgi:murein DD-endopeptidase MepM/ murein hydrolase activator NlpD